MCLLWRFFSDPSSPLYYPAVYFSGCRQLWCLFVVCEHWMCESFNDISCSMSKNEFTSCSVLKYSGNWGTIKPHPSGWYKYITCLLGTVLCCFSLSFSTTVWKNIRTWAGKNHMVISKMGCGHCKSHEWWCSVAEVNSLDPWMLPDCFLYRKEPGYEASFSPLFRLVVNTNRK